MATFLLWNVNHQPLDGLVQNLVRQWQVDVVLLIEYAFGTSQLPGLLRQEGLFKRPSSERFGVFVRADHRLSRLRYRLGSRVGLWKWVPPSGQEGLIVLLHGLDRRNYDDSTRRVFFRRVADAVRRREEARKHRHTIVAGDFNAHPFESAIVDSDGLHAIGVQAVRTSTARAVRGAGAATEFFYNPMWRTYGHQQHPEAGAATHYWLGSWAHELGWFMLDQVVLRPGESVRFPENQLRIITQVGALSLLDSGGLPDSRTASDHLPIVFQWNL
jgi:exonuclease III